MAHDHARARCDHRAVPSETDLVLRLLLAAALAGALGIERELTEQPAGFRTHILVGLGAALFAVVSAFGFQAIVGAEAPHAVNVDVGRVASQVVVGIGFLGGGAIIKYGASIRGLTTAASLWVTAAIGTAVGVGLLLLAAVTAGITLLALVGLRPLRTVLRRYAVGREELAIEADTDVDLDRLLAIVRDAGVTIHEIRIPDEGRRRSLRLLVKVAPGGRPGTLAALLAGQEHVLAVDWSGP